MKDILFRGKRVDNSEWAEGFVIQNMQRSKTYIGDTFEIVEVDPVTVGQYTGLTDKSGKRIFEGDIVKYTFDSPDDPTATENGLKLRVGRVFWQEWRATFAVTGGRNGSTSLNQDVAVYVRGRGIYQYVRGANTVEVIGNIYDNPELLDDGDDE